MQDFMTIAKKTVRILNNLCKRANSVRLILLERHIMYIVRTLVLFNQNLLKLVFLPLLNKGWCP